MAKRRAAKRREENEVEFSRIVAFSDGVFAIAITLLVLNFEISHRLAGDEIAFDGRLSALNLFYLAWIILIPFSSEVLGEYGGHTPPSAANHATAPSTSPRSSWPRSRSPSSLPASRPCSDSPSSSVRSVAW